ncbi:MAG: hypothetical protein JW787_18460 [Sedimentisphaerales bacterium]|nr:hypothetical protein [Sedimentisphaerales bacterium]
MEFFEEQLSQIIPLAVKWAQEGECFALEDGRPLEPDEQEDAHQAGVLYPENIRICFVRDIPRPVKGVLAEANQSLNFITDTTAGLTLNYGIFIKRSCQNDRYLYFHEFVHVSQYESLGGITQFLNRYLRECVEQGYENSALENEAVKKTEKFKNQHETNGPNEPEEF